MAPDDHMIIPFQNENLVAYIEKPDGTRSVCRSNAPISISDYLNI